MTKQVLNDSEIKTLLIDELRYFDAICRDNSIRYFLFYGSLIGAMRHKGFIPWDDDIDVCMPRADFMKLLEVISPGDRYQVVSIYNDSSFTAPLAKLIDTKTLLIQHYGLKEQTNLGVYIDLFVFDGLPGDYGAAWKRFRRAKKHGKHWAVANHGWRYDGTIIKDVLRFGYYLPQHILGYRHYLKVIDEFAKEFEFDSCDYVGNLMYPVYNAVYQRSDFVPMEAKFEGLDVIVPRGYDRVLTACYGEWSELPPVSKRISHHDYECYWVG